jgi:hypothetical protein
MIPAAPARPVALQQHVNKNQKNGRLPLANILMASITSQLIEYE